MSIKRVLLSCVLAAALVTPAFAAKLDGPPGSGVTLTTPDGWKAKAAGNDQNGMLVFDSPDDAASVMFILTDGAKLDDALKGLDALLSKLITEPKLEKPAKGKVNGMPALILKGTAKKVGGGDIGVALEILQTKTGKALIVFAAVDAAKFKTYKSTLTKVLTGVKPSK